MATILLVEDEKNARRVLALNLQSRGHEVTGCADPVAAEALMDRQTFDIILTDLRMHGEDGGLDVIRMGRKRQPAARILLITAYASAETAVTAMKEGAFDYLIKPVSGEELTLAVERALVDRDGSPAVALEESVTGDDEMGLTGRSLVIRRVRERIKKAAKRDFTVLITGESGTGKELAARLLHQQSTRHHQPFVPVHCGAIPPDLIESELFGHRRGAFTGADSDRPGMVEAADHGTLFLDEIGEMPLPAQVKLLRMLQDHHIRRVGDEHERKIDVRIVAATHRDLSSEVKAGRFREDLFYRLNVIPVYIPPLRQRQEDIPELVNVLLKRWQVSGEPLPRIKEQDMQRIQALPLMGNVRELENLLQRMLALSDGDQSELSFLDESHDRIMNDTNALPLDSVFKDGLDQYMDAQERRLIAGALEHESGNVTRTAKLLKVSFRSLRYRLRKLGLRGDQLS